ncbi:hypothetical protein BD779DRAFT_253854 [Infundibulicybe gibba]|nr:hypothetical protein BD779DRAFT_253854 [Infundibulicybe gibba]
MFLAIDQLHDHHTYHRKSQLPDPICQGGTPFLPQRHVGLEYIARTKYCTPLVSNKRLDSGIAGDVVSLSTPGSVQNLAQRLVQCVYCPRLFRRRGRVAPIQDTALFHSNLNSGIYPQPGSFIASPKSSATDACILLSRGRVDPLRQAVAGPWSIRLVPRVRARKSEQQRNRELKVANKVLVSCANASS